jgi:hypothetical protein
VDRRLKDRLEEGHPPKVIFVITTDGMENASVEFDYEKIQSLIQHRKAHGKWEFIFLGANMDAIKEADQLGIEMENAYNFNASKAGVEEMYSVINEVVVEKRKP